LYNVRSIVKKNSFSNRGEVSEITEDSKMLGLLNLLNNRRILGGILAGALGGVLGTTLLIIEPKYGVETVIKLAVGTGIAWEFIECFDNETGTFFIDLIKDCFYFKPKKKKLRREIENIFDKK